MRKSEDIFFFTLIDFLIQVCFFGLLLYVLAQGSQSAAKKVQKDDAEKIQRLITATGVSNLTELTDELTKLAPIKELKGTSDFISRVGGVEEARKVSDMVTQAGSASRLGTALAEAKEFNAVIVQAGGVEKITASLEKLRKFEEGSGKPPCLFNDVSGRKLARPLATVVATDTTISFQESNADLDEVLQLLGRTYASVRELPLAEFRAIFAPLAQKKPDCRYTLRFHEKTTLIHARDAARFTFYLKI